MIHVDKRNSGTHGVVVHAAISWERVAVAQSAGILAKVPMIGLFSDLGRVCTYLKWNPPHKKRRTAPDGPGL